MSEIQNSLSPEIQNPAAEEFVFSAKGITKVFGGTHALKGVELEVKPGEIVGLVGENIDISAYI